MTRLITIEAVERERERERERGITLITLVVTVIVLLILAGVTLGLVFNSDGLFEKASAGASKYSQKQAEEILTLTLQEAQMKKYAEGLKDEQLDNMINKIGKVSETNKSLVTVDKYIFEIDRTVPKILQYKGESDNIEHGTHGNEESNTENNKTPKVEIIKMTLTTDGKTIKFGALGTSNTSQIDYFNYLISPTEGILEEKANGTFKSDETVEVTTTKAEEYTIIVTATDKSGNTTPIGNAKKLAVITNGGTITPTPTLPAKGEDVPEAGWTVEQAKGIVERDGLQAHLGEKVQYSPEQDTEGVYRIFYYDNEVNSEDASKGYFGDPLGTLYLKRDYVSKDTTLGGHQSHTPSDSGEIMKRMNPKWSKETNGSLIDLANEHCVAWLCDPVQWTKYKVAGAANYVIGSPSVEMYMKAYGVYKETDGDQNRNSTSLVCKIDTLGYSVGANNTYSNSGYYTNINTIEAGPNNIFMTAGSNHWWLASPSSRGSDNVNLVIGTDSIGFVNYVSGTYASATFGVCPLVSISQ